MYRDFTFQPKQRQLWGWKLILLLCGSMHTLTAFAETLSIETVLQKSVDRSFELKISQVDISLARNALKSSKSDYFPVIRSSMNMEYQRSLQSQVGQVTSVNNSVLPYGTRFQNSLSVNMNHTLLDFGVRKHKVLSARAGIDAKASEYFQAKRELQLKLIELYTDALINYKNKKAYEAMFQLAQKEYLMKRRLHQAGNLSNIPVAEDAIQMAQYLDNIEVYKDQYGQKLQAITAYTHETYDPDTVELEDLVEDTPSDPITIQISKTPEAHIYDALIAQKEAEIVALQRQYLPSLSWYSYYSLYGYDADHWQRAVANLSQRTVSLGLSMSLPVFDGFKTQIAIEKAKLEKERLKLQKEEKLAQLQNQVDLYNRQVQGYNVELKTKAVILNKTQDKLSMLNRLSEKQIIDSTQAIQEHITRIQKQLELEKAIIQQVTAIKKLKILAEGT